MPLWERAGTCTAIQPADRFWLLSWWNSAFPESTQLPISSRRIRGDSHRNMHQLRAKTRLICHLALQKAPVRCMQGRHHRGPRAIRLRPDSWKVGRLRASFTPTASQASRHHICLHARQRPLAGQRPPMVGGEALEVVMSPKCCLGLQALEYSHSPVASIRARLRLRAAWCYSRFCDRDHKSLHAVILSGGVALILVLPWRISFRRNCQHTGNAVRGQVVAKRGARQQRHCPLEIDIADQGLRARLWHINEYGRRSSEARRSASRAALAQD